MYVQSVSARLIPDGDRVVRIAYCVLRIVRVLCKVERISSFKFEGDGGDLGGGEDEGTWGLCQGSSGSSSNSNSSSRKGVLVILVVVFLSSNSGNDATKKRREQMDRGTPINSTYLVPSKSLIHYHYHLPINDLRWPLEVMQ